MKKKDLEITQKVVLDNEIVDVVYIGKKEIIVETLRGKRKYTNAGSLSNPVVKIQITLPIKIVADEFDYHVSSPQLKGFHTCGETINECLRNAKAAGEGFILSYIKHYNLET